MFNFFRKESKESRVRLDLEDFRKLVHWGEISKDWAKIILADIGYVVMRDIIEAALSDYIKKVRWEY